MRKSRCSQRDAPRIVRKYSLFWSVAPNRRPDKGRLTRYAIGQGRMAVPVCTLTLQRNNDDDFDRKRSRKDEAKQLVADFGPEGLVRLTDNAGVACSGMKPGRTSGIGSMLSADKVETAQAGMPSDQPIGLLSRGISTDEEPAIGV